MLDKIKSSVWALFPLYDQRWIFLSAFDSFDKLLISQWVVFTDRSLETLIEAIYSNSLAPKASNIKYVVVDIVTWYEEITEKTKNLLTNSDPKLYWFGFHDLETWAISMILPNTSWVENIGQAIWALKAKAKSNSSRVDICRFTTNRIIVK